MIKFHIRFCVSTFRERCVRGLTEYLECKTVWFQIQVLTHSVMRKHKKRGVDALYTSCARIRESLLIRGHDVRTESAKLQPDRILAVNQARALRFSCLHQFQGRSHFSWNDVGGLSHIKHALNDMIKLPLSYPKLFHKFSKGALLYGPPVRVSSTMNCSAHM